MADLQDFSEQPGPAPAGRAPKRGRRLLRRLVAGLFLATVVVLVIEQWPQVRPLLGRLSWPSVAAATAAVAAGPPGHLRVLAGAVGRPGLPAAAPGRAAGVLPGPARQVPARVDLADGDPDGAGPRLPGAPAGVGGGRGHRHAARGRDRPAGGDGAAAAGRRRARPIPLGGGGAAGSGAAAGRPTGAEPAAGGGAAGGPAGAAAGPAVVGRGGQGGGLGAGRLAALRHPRVAAGPAAGGRRRARPAAGLDRAFAGAWAVGFLLVAAPTGAGCAKARSSCCCAPRSAGPRPPWSGSSPGCCSWPPTSP